MTVTHMYADEPTALYRLYDTNEVLLYLGISRFPKYRLREHEDNQSWWHLVARTTVEWHENRTVARETEVRATKEEKPLYDKEWRHSAYDPKAGYDDTADRRLVRETLIARINDGSYPAGTVLGTGSVSRELGIARTTVSYILGRLAAEDKVLRKVHHGRYTVIGSVT
ncbi:GntR family transcriptional regulator [Streptomyces sp. 2133.1]|uniref:GntR family transcriptional regulator n=1 Tax=Streptomyces sp. 2133.1 TaxID=1881021 RepID=UPI000897176B|nr:GntR family transcriptional regulator [Streptomyces sp. 2133.1]SEE48472.1 regulatory protein, gntR family [Streptomyces sp. 2133.1]